jgi:hypothetical protein
MFGENLPIHSFSRVDKNVGAGLSKTGPYLQQRSGCLMHSKGNDFLLDTWTLTMGLWVMMDIPDEMKKVFGSPIPATFHCGFSTELKTAVARLWRRPSIRQRAAAP